ncbi:hypothetical protein [Deinococcus sp. PESE-13]
MSETLQQLYDEAAERLEAFHKDLLTWVDVVAWADAWILQLLQSPEALIEVSLSQSRLRDGIDALGQLSCQSDEATVLPFLKALWREKYQAGQIDELSLTEQARSLLGVYIPYISDEYVQVRGLEHLMDEATGTYLLTDEQKQKSLLTLERELRKWLNS